MAYAASSDLRVSRMAGAMRQFLFITVTASLLFAFQNCGDPSYMADTVSFASSDPRYIADLRISASSSDTSVNTQFNRILSEELTIVLVLSQQTPAGTLFEINNGSTQTEGLRISKEKTQLRIEFGTRSDQLQVVERNLDWQMVNVLAVRLPKKISSTAILFNGELLSYTNPDSSSLAYVERQLINTEISHTALSDLYIYSRALNKNEFEGVQGFFQRTRQIEMQFHEWHRVDYHNGAPNVPVISYQSDILPVFQANHCFQCHGVNQPNMQSYTPQQLRDSVFRGVAPMPIGYPSLTAQEKQLIADWVNGGAQP